MKRIISIVLSLIMILGMLPLSAVTANASMVDIPAAPSPVDGVTGTGTFKDPYVATTGDQLEDLIATKKDMNIKIGANLNLDKTLYIRAEVYIDMNGKNITSKAENGAINVKSGGLLTMNGNGEIIFNGNYYAVFVEGTFETMGSITYETKNASYSVVNIHQYGIARIYGGTFKGSQIDNNGVGQVYIYSGTFEKIIYNGPNALTAIYGGTFMDSIGTQGVVYIYDGAFHDTVNAYYNGVITIYAGHFAAGIATSNATGTYKKGETSYCLSHKNKTTSEADLYFYEEVTVYRPEFANQVPNANGKNEIDGGTVDQYDSYTVGFTAKDLPTIFAEAGFAIEEKLIVKDSAGNVEYSESNKGTSAKGIYYNMQGLDGGDYTVERIVNLYRDGNVVETKNDTVKVKVNPISESEFGFKTMTPAVSAEDKVSKYTDLGEKEYSTTLIFGYTPQLSQTLVNKGYSTKEVVYVNYNNQGTLVTRKTGSNFDLMQYVDRMGDYQVWFSLQLYKDGEYVTSVGHIYNVTIVPIAVNTLKANVTAPVDGALPNATVTPAGEGYKTTDVDWSYYDETADDYYLMPDGMKFEAGKTYECAVQFEVVSDEYVFADDKAYMAGYINGYKGVISPVYSNKKAYVTVKFTVPDDQLKVIFTPDSKPQAGSKLTVDIEAMAERDDALMEAYLDNAVTYKWFYDGRLQYATKNNSYELKNSNIGHYVAVKVIYGDEVIISEEFLIEEAKITGLLGDVNEDGIVNIIDATAVQKYLANLSELSETGLKLADVDGNGIVNIIDATTIQKHLAGIETGYAIGKPI